jgi:hypothetical protein
MSMTTYLKDTINRNVLDRLIQKNLHQSEHQYACDSIFNPSKKPWFIINQGFFVFYSIAILKSNRKVKNFMTNHSDTILFYFTLRLRVK